MFKLNASQRLKAYNEGQIKVEADKETKKWSAPVTNKVTKHPKEGTFKGSSDEIAKELKRLHGKDFQSAMSALNFYINRAGEGMSNRKNVEGAKNALRRLYGKEEE